MMKLETSEFDNFFTIQFEFDNGKVSYGFVLDKTFTVEQLADRLERASKLIREKASEGKA